MTARNPVTYSWVEGYGVGRITRSNDDGSAMVAFLDVPGVKPAEVMIRRTNPRQLLDNTRVWIEPGPDSRHWRAGRILASRNDNGTYWIALPNIDRAEIAEERVWTRWEREPSDLFGMLENLVAETPYLYISRLHAMRTLTTQLSLMYGLTGLWSSLIELHEHQLEAARRVLSDPLPRYLLADEVGLGKTIEAGLVIRQHLTDDPSARVLVLTPSHLTRQWQDEMEQKFMTSDFVTGRITISSHGDLDSVRTDYSLVVVDEIHRLARHPRDASPSESATYARLMNVCQATPRLLLLTATPVRAQGIDFLAILHLLDPASHPLDDVDAFEHKLVMRGPISEAMLGFDDELPRSFVDVYVQHFRDLVPNDLELSRRLNFLQDLAKTNEDIKVAIRQVKAHIAHRYRLYSRMIRSRRTGRLLQEFPVRGRKLKEVVTTSSNHEETKEVLDLVISMIRDSDQLTQATLQSFKDLLSLMITGYWPSEASRAEAEQAFGTGIVARCERAVHEANVATRRIETILDFCTNLRSANGGQHNKPKVFFSSSPAFADALGQALGEKWGNSKVVRLTTHSDGIEVRRQIEAFREKRGNAFLVCDATVEEGVNLQFSDLVVLTDLPMTSGSLEQRIGRFDRFSEKYDPIELVVIGSDHFFESLWLEYLNSTGIFNESVANLQYALNDRDALFFTTWLSLGLEQLLPLIESTSDFVSNEKREIAKQEALDAFELDLEISPFMTSLKKADRNLAADARPILDWADCLGFKAPGTVNDPPKIYRGVARLGKPRRSGLLFNATVAQRMRPELWNDGFAVDRSFALDEKGIRLLGVGHPVIEAILRFSRFDERGRVCARLLSDRRIAPESLYLYADLHLFVEPDNAKIDLVADELGLDAFALRTQCRQWFSTVLVSYYLNADGDAVSESVQKIINSPYSKDETNDQNLGGSGYDVFVNLSSSFDWSQYCRRMEKRALDLCSKDKQVTEAISNAVQLANEHFDSVSVVLASRVQSGLEPANSLAASEDLRHRIMSILASPKSTFDSIRVTFLKGAES